MLNYEELEEIIEEITAKITLANRTGELESLLKSWGLENLLSNQSSYETDRDGKIVVVGASEVKENILSGIIKSFGLDKNRFEFCLDYNKAKTYPYKNFDIILIIELLFLEQYNIAALIKKTAVALLQK